jgi:hypothetical protein
MKDTINIFKYVNIFLGLSSVCRNCPHRLACKEQEALRIRPHTPLNGHVCTEMWENNQLIITEFNDEFMYITSISTDLQHDLDSRNGSR